MATENATWGHTRIRRSRLCARPMLRLTAGPGSAIRAEFSSSRCSPARNVAGLVCTEYRPSTRSWACGAADPKHEFRVGVRVEINRLLTDRRSQARRLPHSQGYEAVPCSARPANGMVGARLVAPGLVSPHAHRQIGHRGRGIDRAGRSAVGANQHEGWAVARTNVGLDWPCSKCFLSSFLDDYCRAYGWQ